MPKAQEFVDIIESNVLDFIGYESRWGNYRIRLNKGDIEKHEEILKKFLIKIAKIQMIRVSTLRIFETFGKYIKSLSIVAMLVFNKYILAVKIDRMAFIAVDSKTKKLSSVRCSLL